jgi:hypothetical protein
MQKILKRVSAVLLAVIAVIATILGADPGNGPPTSSPTTITIHVDGIDADRKADDPVTVPAADVAVAAAVTEQNLRDETPPVAQAAPDQLAAQQQLVEKVKRTKDPLPVAGATQGFPGCRTEFVRNQSSRNGVRPIWQVDHYTVSPNRPGWSDVNAIVALFNNPNAQVSAHFVIDGEGNCAYIVPIEQKAWANAAGNSLSIQYEIINSGHESVYLAPAGQARLKAVQLEVKRRTGIPVSRGSVYPARSGLVQHKDGGLPWGGHVDITPYSIDQQVQLVNAPTRVTINHRDRAACRKVHKYRPRRHHTRRELARRHHRIHRLHHRGLHCVNGKVRRFHRKP